MSKRGSNKRREPKRKLKVRKRKRNIDYESELFDKKLLYKKEKEQIINKRYLILCEGETEYTYFSGLGNNILLREKFKAVNIDIISPSNRKNSSPRTSLIDNSIKGMVWEAMKRKRKADKEGVPYDEIWLVFDNDEGNSYVISKKTLVKAKSILNLAQLEKYTTFLGCFFLSDFNYEEFLHNEIGLDYKETQAMMSVTDKNRFFEDFENSDPKAQFYKNGKFVYRQDKKKNLPDEKDFDQNWKKWLQKAYSCRTFEHWLILHFEACKRPFSVSTEDESASNLKNSIHHLWTFAPKFCKGFGKNEKINAYNILKPHLYNEKHETEAEAQAVIDKINSAILYSFWLRQEMQAEQDLQNGKYYEVNPYTDVNYLLSSLLGKEVFYGTLDCPINFDNTQVTYQLNLETNSLQVELINQSVSNRILINNTNIGQFFKILTINKEYQHTFTSALSLNETVNIISGNSTPYTFKVQFASIPKGIPTYIVFQNKRPDHFLYLPIFVC